jgi:hypothetical protein
MKSAHLEAHGKPPFEHDAQSARRGETIGLGRLESADRAAKTRQRSGAFRGWESRSLCDGWLELPANADWRGVAETEDAINAIEVARTGTKDG